MGQDKALIRLDGETLLHRSLQKLGRLFREVLIVTDKPGRYRTDAAKEVTDIYRECGPLGGIHAGIYAAAYDWTLITACDMPFWEASIADELMAARSGYDAVVPKSGIRPEPLFALYRKSCLPAIQECLDQNVFKVTRFYEKINVHYEDIGYKKGRITPQPFSNINTPEDLYDIRASDISGPK